MDADDEATGDHHVAHMRATDPPHQMRAQRFFPERRGRRIVEHHQVGGTAGVELSEGQPEEQMVSRVMLKPVSSKVLLETARELLTVRGSR